VLRRDTVRWHRSGSDDEEKPGAHFLRGSEQDIVRCAEGHALRPRPCHPTRFQRPNAARRRPVPPSSAASESMLHTIESAVACLRISGATRRLLPGAVWLGRGGRPVHDRSLPHWRRRRDSNMIIRDNEHDELPVQVCPARYAKNRTWQRARSMAIGRGANLCAAQPVTPTAHPLREACRHP
jgi:hypothetical protein